MKNEYQKPPSVKSCWEILRDGRLLLYGVQGAGKNSVPGIPKKY